ncbi:glycosyltransferase family 2 protein [Caulobacter sp. NIBR2454]|uniref:glycosyltransferase family 2 protein n=1 Tax=Caulobacter sp. NIBR2454 TaxID=3015996 RepID=UPI0022B6B69C|nr:glycosyltransferase [Caulobacter sp. NIBR2454]
MAREERDGGARAVERSRATVSAIGLAAQDGAARGPTLAQKAVLAGVILAMTGLAISDLKVGWMILYGLLFSGFGLSVALRLGAMLLARPGGAWRPRADDDLPHYTVIVPLYQEAAMLPGVVAAMQAIDYPRDRLQVIIAVEEDDLETQAAMARLRTPAFISMMIAPPGSPRTKPRACNIALQRARGRLVVVFDAEDRPHPQQLREAAARFAAGPPDLACLQAPLRIDADRRFIPAQFAVEYAVQFEVFLPALARLGLPFPLGGTSNHFRTRALREVGGWDAHNVTEDADLGFRLAAKGWKLGMLASPTFEPAPVTLTDWLPQRARWVKGHMQSFGVHSRRMLGQSPRFNAALLATLGLSSLSVLLHGPAAAWIIATTLAGWMAGDALPVAARDLALLLAGWAASAGCGVIGLRRAGSPVRPRDILMAPLYWPMLSLAAAHAVWQLIRAPYHWDKTRHSPVEAAAGLDAASSLRVSAGTWTARNPRWRTRPSSCAPPPGAITPSSTAATGASWSATESTRS